MTATVHYPVLIFDLDDTLIESFPGYVRLHQQIADDLGWSIPSAAELVHYGPTWEATLARLWPNRSLEPFLARYEQIADDHQYPAIVGVCDALTQLRARGHSLWIVTKRSRSRLAQRMDQAGLAQALFSGIFAYEDQPVAKPDPRCFEPVWAALGQVERERAIYVGDRADDHEAASAAGLRFVGVRTGPEHHAQPERPSFLDALPTEHVLDSAADLPAWLTRLHEPTGLEAG